MHIAFDKSNAQPTSFFQIYLDVDWYRFEPRGFLTKNDLNPEQLLANENWT